VLNRLNGRRKAVIGVVVIASMGLGSGAFALAAAPGGTFVPLYIRTADAESAEFRKFTRPLGDPYAVGGFSPDGAGDRGGKSYGTYQFETYRTGKDGATITALGKQNHNEETSTVRRFVKSDLARDFPKLAQFTPASEAFDKAWKEYATTFNKAFGEAQERFMISLHVQELTAWFTTANVVDGARSNALLTDIVMGSINQYGTHATWWATAVAKARTAKGSALTVKEIGYAMQDAKLADVNSTIADISKGHFANTPKPSVLVGVRNRIIEERRLFDKA
jgi:hypothetical protein